MSDIYQGIGFVVFWSAMLVGAWFLIFETGVFRWLKRRVYTHSWIGQTLRYWQVRRYVLAGERFKEFDEYPTEYLRKQLLKMKKQSRFYNLHKQFWIKALDKEIAKREFDKQFPKEGEKKPQIDIDLT